MTTELAVPVPVAREEKSVKEEESSPESSKRSNWHSKFQKIFEGGGGCHRVALFTHRGPDPDAIGSMIGMKWLLDKAYGIESECFYAGSISHPQNLALVNLLQLDPDLRSVEEYDPAVFGKRLLVDTVPANAGLNGNPVSFDVVVDHHKEVPNGGFNGLFVNLRAGSCCATVYEMIRKHNAVFANDNDHDARVATAMMVGIATDTEHMMSNDTTDFEFKAWSGLFPYRNVLALSQIVAFERPKYWVDTKAAATLNATVNEGVAIVGLGSIPIKHRDMIADMSDEMVTWEGVHTAVAFAIVDGNRVEGSVRSNNASCSVSTLCKSLGEKYDDCKKKVGDGGGKLGKGAYHYSLGGGAIEDEDDSASKEETWQALKNKETKRLFRLIKT